MRFSVLLPTRNGGKFLRTCIGAILDQPYREFELVVSDNANTDETPQILRSFHDPRLKVLRLDPFVNVTENWNNALRASQGDYFVMMGDDDYLLPNYFANLERELEQFGCPDVIGYNAYSFVCPGTMDHESTAYYGDPYFQPPDERFEREGELPPSFRREIVRDMFRFINHFPMNMQMFLVSRAAADRIRGGVFQPPFPDHFAVNALLLDARRFVFLPRHFHVVVGVTPKSFGYYFFNGHQQQGLRYLSIDTRFQGRLPGDEIINATRVWLDLLKRTYPDRLVGSTVSRPHYLQMQLRAWILEYRLGKLPIEGLLARLGRISLPEWPRVVGSLLVKLTPRRLARVLRRGPSRNKLRASLGTLRPIQNVLDIGEFARWIGERRA
ncbi:MAG: glycosyltransferase family 2 protein [Planctomycetes bacterium]|nr:glycosyltransferase family 2 protein [Planctomycetota bacterium]